MHMPYGMVLLPYLHATLNMDKAGRIVLPKSIRNQPPLSAGDVFVLELSGNSIVLKPRK